MSKPTGKKDGKKKVKKPQMIGNETAGQVVKRLDKAYEKFCAIANSAASDRLHQLLTAAMENEILLEKFIVESNTVNSTDDPQVRLEPLVSALRQERYTFLQDLRIWNVPTDLVDAASLALLLEKRIIPIRLLEFMNCLLSSSSLTRLARSFPVCTTLTHLSFDYNDLGDQGCEGLCEGLVDNVTLLSLSLRYCDLGVGSGCMLGHILATTSLRELYVDGNNLGCEGALALVLQCSRAAEAERREKIQAQQEAEDRAARLEEEKKNMGYSGTEDVSGDEVKSVIVEKPEKQKGKKEKKSKEPPPPPAPGPWIHKLHIADNGIDMLGPRSTSPNPNNMEVFFDEHMEMEITEYSSGSSTHHSLLPLCINEYKRLVLYSECLEELDLEDNLIGNFGGMEILSALQKREEAGLPGIKIRTTHRMHPDTLNEIIKLGNGLKKKKKRGKKKKK